MLKSHDSCNIMNCGMTHLQNMRKSWTSSSSKTVRDSLGWLCWPALPLVLLPVSPSPFFACKKGVLWHPHFAYYVKNIGECTPDPRYCTLWIDVLITMRKLIASTVQVAITLLYINTKIKTFLAHFRPAVIYLRYSFPIDCTKPLALVYSASIMFSFTYSLSKKGMTRKRSNAVPTSWFL